MNPKNSRKKITGSLECEREVTPISNPLWRKEPATLLHYQGQFTMMQRKIQIQINDVNGTRDHSGRRTSSGRRIGRSRAYVDRHPVTGTKHPQNLRTLRTQNHRIATWNVRTLHQQGKLDNVILEMDRLKLSVLGLCEVRWKNAGQLVKGDKTVIYSGGDQHHRGVALILNKQFL